MSRNYRGFSYTIPVETSRILMDDHGINADEEIQRIIDDLVDTVEDKTLKIGDDE